HVHVCSMVWSNFTATKCRGLVSLNQGSKEIIFFFSSRRRHTRFSRDWSSDVCSSDLEQFRVGLSLVVIEIDDTGHGIPEDKLAKIGRASCRERVELSEDCGPFK